MLLTVEKGFSLKFLGEKYPTKLNVLSVPCLTQILGPTLKREPAKTYDSLCRVTLFYIKFEAWMGPTTHHRLKKRLLIMLVFYKPTSTGLKVNSVLDREKIRFGMLATQLKLPVRYLSVSIPYSRSLRSSQTNKIKIPEKI